MFLSRLSALPGLMLFVGAVAARDAAFIDRVQMGDNDLDCRQIAAQVKEIDAILAPLQGDKGAIRGATGNVTRSRTGAVVAGVAKELPFGSIFGDIAKEVLGRRGKEAEARVASARARKEYLVDLFLKRKCRMADLESVDDKAKTANADAAGARDVTTPAPRAPETGTSSPVVESPAARAAKAAVSSQSSSVPAVEAPKVAPPPAAKPEERVPAAAVSAPQPSRGSLFVLDFRLAFRISADPDGKDGGMGLALGGVPLTTMQAITDTAYVALLKDLAVAGFEVLNPELAAAPASRGSLPAPARSGDYLYFAPSGAPLAQAPVAAVPGSDVSLAETRAALAQAVSGRKPGVTFGIGVWYVDFARVRGKADSAEPRQIESRVAVAAGSHLALVEPAASETTSPDAVRVLNLGRNLVSHEPYGQVRLTGGGTLELKADPQRFKSLAEQQLQRSRSALLASLPPPPAIGEAISAQSEASSPAGQPAVPPPVAP